MKLLLLIAALFITTGLRAERPVSADPEVVRVKNEIREIQAKPSSKDKKLKELQALSNREMAKDRPKAIKDCIKKCIDTAKETAQGVQALGRG